MLDNSQYDPYSPKRVDDIVGNAEILGVLLRQIRENMCPHIVLCGPAGCGKSLFLRIALEGRPLLNIDCTANSGLRDLRDVLRGFSRGSKTNEGNFRWIVLEHSDALAADTQAFLRRMMETTSSSARIVFECRDAGAISEPILSRSSLVVLSAPELTEVAYELKRRTNFLLPEAAVQEIANLSGGNMRKALMNVLAHKWNPELGLHNMSSLKDQLAKKPVSEKEWIQWAIETEQFCRSNGFDIRDVLQIMWPNNSHVFYICSQWSRLGGISPRSLFYECIGRIYGDTVHS